MNPINNRVLGLLTIELKRAGKETRTPDPNLGKVMLYQLSYSRLNLHIKDRNSKYLCQGYF